jgi:cyclopropane-fatty-acyl-phospholipid synthase
VPVNIAALLGKIAKKGNIEVETADGVKHKLGDGTGPLLGLKLTDKAAERELLMNPALTFGELFMDGRMLVTHGTLYDLIDCGARNLAAMQDLSWVKAIDRVRVAFRGVHQRNGRRNARKNISHHYDLDAKFYRMFLDEDMQYSCAYFEHEGDTLEQAQLAKKRHIVAKMLLDEGQSVLDIGCGFGGMALYCAGVAGARATGVTLSQEQLQVAKQRAQASGVADRLDFRLQDYRDVKEKFDRIVSVGMFEHVGVARYDEYFQGVKRLLKDDGVALIHSIGRNAVPGATNPWIRKYIFPGGYIPSLSEVLPAIERAGLYVTDVEVLRLHYAETLREWRRRFMERREEVRKIYDERFCRMWEFYLAGSESSFRVDGHMVFQIQLAKKQESVPLTREYIAERENGLRRREGPRRPLRHAAE